MRGVSQVTVYIRVVFLKIGEIDTLKEHFMADAFIQARWREPALDGQASQVGCPVVLWLLGAPPKKDLVMAPPAYIGEGGNIQSGCDVCDSVCR